MLSVSPPCPGSPEDFSDQKSNAPSLYFLNSDRDGSISGFAAKWIDDQDYLHSILHGLFLTKSMNPNPDLLRLLLTSGRINVNYYCATYGGYLSLLRYRAGNNQNDKLYLLRCLHILYYAGYDFVNNPISVTNIKITLLQFHMRLAVRIYY